MTIEQLQQKLTELCNAGYGEATVMVLSWSYHSMKPVTQGVHGSDNYLMLSSDNYPHTITPKPMDFVVK